jgi:mRNA interferase MazF
MNIERWAVWLANLDPNFGTEAGKMRPVLVIQTDLLNATHFSTAVLPITTNVTVNAQILRFNLGAILPETGLSQNSDVLIDQIRTIDNKRLKRKLGQIKDIGARQAIENQLKIVLDL